jgi:hypothetical protein
VNSFRKTLNEFRGELHDRAAQTPGPRLQALLDRQRPATPHTFRWVAAAIVVVTLGSIPLYHDARERARQEQERADAQLLEQINASLSRSVPRAFGALTTGSQH